MCLFRPTGLNPEWQVSTRTYLLLFNWKRIVLLMILIILT